MQVREMMPSDLPTLRKIYLRARQQTFTWENAAHMQLNDFDTDTAGELVLCAINGKRMIGFVTIWRPTDFIHCLFIDPNQQGQGVGRRLLDCALMNMKHPASLKCVAKNGRALSFYERNGWRRTTLDVSGEPYWNMIFS